MATVQIKGMSCMHCVGSVNKTLSEIEGITDVQVDLQKGEASYNEAESVSSDVIKDAIAKIGFEVV